MLPFQFIKPNSSLGHSLTPITLCPLYYWPGQYSTWWIIQSYIAHTWYHYRFVINHVQTATCVVLFPLKVYNASISHYSGLFLHGSNYHIKRAIRPTKNHYCYFTLHENLFLQSIYCWGRPLKTWLSGEPSIIVAVCLLSPYFQMLNKNSHNLAVLHPIDFLWSSLFLLWMADYNGIKKCYAIQNGTFLQS